MPTQVENQAVFGVVAVPGPTRRKVPGKGSPPKVALPPRELVVVAAPEAGLRADVLTLAMLRFTARHERDNGTPQPRLYDERGASHPHVAPVSVEA